MPFVHHKVYMIRQYIICNFEICMGSSFLASQITCLVMWGLEGGSRPWTLVIGLILTSFGWWEAYLPYRAAIIVPSLFAFLRDVSILFIYQLFTNHTRYRSSHFTGARPNSPSKKAAYCECCCGHLEDHTCLHLPVMLHKHLTASP